MKKLLALLLAALTLLPLFVACQDTSSQSGETTNGGTKSPSETEDPFDPKVPKADYNEREFLFMVPASGDMWGELSYNREEDNGDAIESAIYNRNRYVEDYFNLSGITTVTEGSTGEQAAKFQTYAVSGEDKIDIIATGFYQSGKPLIVNDYVLPWNDVAYINLEKDWWNKGVTKTLSILGNIYYLVGDVNWFTLPETSVCYFNKVVAYEKTLMGKVKRDDESEEMLDIIFSNILYDFGICYCTDLSYIPCKTLVETNNKSIGSWYKRISNKFELNYTELYDHVCEKVNGVAPA